MQWRYYLDEVEVHLPPLWEQYIADENYVELIRTQTLPLVISLNGHSLVNYAIEQPALPPLIQPASTNSCRKLSDDERIAVEKYLAALAKRQPPRTRARFATEAEALTLTAQSNHVYPVTRSITRYGLSTDDPHVTHLTIFAGSRTLT
ncbi:hypothetical protein CRX72_27090 [Pantoea sp. BRM17]|nr:hypothetical protein CRX72_27090 [Pantoea sp. BRM17]